MGEKVSESALSLRSEQFFANVIALLVERNKARGDSYLEGDLEDLAGIVRDKGGRIRTCARQDLKDPTVRRELLDSVIDIAGYAALLAIWLEEKLGVTYEEWDRIFRKVDDADSH